MTTNLLLGVHIGLGAVALALFWLAGLLTKGTPAHRWAGRGYLLAMVVVLATAVPLAVLMLQAGQPNVASFLGYLVLITGGACWRAWRAIRDRRHRERYFGRVYWLSAVVIALAGTLMMALGLRIGSSLFTVFGAIGVFGLVDAVVRRRRAASDPAWWLREHYAAIIGNGIAVHIAFLGIGLRNAFPGVDPAIVQSLSWFGPLLVALIAAVWLRHRYGKPGIRAIPQASLPTPP